jgi:hypothetical protein
VRAVSDYDCSVSDYDCSVSDNNCPVSDNDNDVGCGCGVDSNIWKHDSNN